ncbi:MAG: AMP-binding protein [Xanthobacteraceae bacterium]
MITASLGGPTLLDLFARALASHPDAIALADAPNIGRCFGAERLVRRLTFTQVDRTVSGIAGQLQQLGLKTDHVVALHMPNTVEAVLTLLGVLRAGMIAAPMPLLWRRAEAVAALSRIGAKAIVAFGEVGDAHLAELATQVAAEVFPIRAVCGFGRDLPDGVVPFDPLLEGESGAGLEIVEPNRRMHDRAAHVAVVTWDMDAAGPLPVARSHSELLAAGLAVTLEGAIAPRAVIVSALLPTSLAGLATGLVPWLATGGTLCLHPAFDAEVLAGQLVAENAGALVVPGPLATRLVEAGVVTETADLPAVIAVWRTPERLAAGPAWPLSKLALVDLQVFGEIGLIAARRGSDGLPSPVSVGPVIAPRQGAGGMLVAEISRSASGTLAFRGPMTPRFCYPPGAERGDPPFLKLDEAFFIDTGVSCRAERGSGAVTVTAPPRGMVGIGGYRVPLAVFQRLIAEIDPHATLTALPDTLTGQRLAGSSPDGEALRQALARRGVNPLIVGAFRRRSDAAAETMGLRQAG